jgi:hypothetical protein
MIFSLRLSEAMQPEIGEQDAVAPIVGNATSGADVQSGGRMCAGEPVSARAADRAPAAGAGRPSQDPVAEKTPDTSPPSGMLGAGIGRSGQALGGFQLRRLLLERAGKSL